MADDLSDSDSSSSCEWTVLTHDEIQEIPEELNTEEKIPCLQLQPEDTDLTSHSENSLKLLSERQDDASSSYLDDTSRSDTSSDIEKIDEPPLLDSTDFQALWNKDVAMLQMESSLNDLLGRSLSICVSNASGENDHMWETSVLSESTTSKNSDNVGSDFDQVGLNDGLESSEEIASALGKIQSDYTSSKLTSDINDLMDNLISDCCKCDDKHSVSDEQRNLNLQCQQQDTLPSVADSDFPDRSLHGLEVATYQHEDKPRIYRHTPNQRVNIILNTLVLLVVTAVLGLGIGHFIGWSGRWLHQKQVHNTHFTKISELQREVTTCLQQAISPNAVNEIQLCFENTEFWKLLLKELVAENKGLQKNNDDNKDLQISLQVEFLQKQVEYIEAIKKFELQQTEEKKVLQKVKDLEEENTDLKIKLEEESKGDVEDQKIMFMLMKENAKLKLSIEDLQKVNDKVKVAVNDHSKTLREQINQLTFENEDLRSMVARLRYGSQPHLDVPLEIQNNINKLKTENLDLMVEIGKLRYTKPTINEDSPETMQHDKQHEYVAPTFEEYDERTVPFNAGPSSKFYSSFAWIEDELYGILQGGHEVAKKIFNKTVDGYKQIKDNEAMWQKINGKVNGVFEYLNSKWNHLQKSVPDSFDAFKSVLKDGNFPVKENEDSTDADKKSVMHKLGDLYSLFKKKCKDLKNKVSGTPSVRKKEEQQPPAETSPKVEIDTSTLEDEQFQEAVQSFNFLQPGEKGGSKLEYSDYTCVGDECEEIDEGKMKHDWIFQRAWYRENKKLQEKAAEWLFDRARSRQEQRTNSDFMNIDNLASENTNGHQETPTIHKQNDDDDDKYLKGDWYFKNKLHSKYDSVYEWEEADDDDDDDDDFMNRVDHFFSNTKPKVIKTDRWHPRTKYGYATQSEFSDHKFHSNANGKHKNKFKAKKSKYCAHSKNSKYDDFDCLEYYT